MPVLNRGGEDSGPNIFVHCQGGGSLGNPGVKSMIPRALGVALARLARSARLPVMTAKSPLILLPGLLCDAALWAHQTETLADIAERIEEEDARIRFIQNHPFRKQIQEAWEKKGSST